MQQVGFILEGINLQAVTTIIGWDEMISKITAKALWQNINRISPMLSIDATTRYHRFMSEFPTLANRIPFAYIASYLGIPNPR